MRPKKARVKKQCDKKWSEKIRSKGYCEAKELGGCKGILNACHIIRRGANALRHDLDNGICLCVAHHYWFDKGNKFEVTRWFEDKYPGRYDRLKERDIIVHYKLHDFEEIKKELDDC